MKKKVMAFIFVLILVIVNIAPASAGGDKVRGDNGQGIVEQTQVQDPPPFQ